MFLENTEYSTFDMRDVQTIDIKVWSAAMTGRIVFGATPLDVISSYSEFSGRMRALPDWIGEGVVVSVQGGTAAVRQKLDAINAAGIPLAALWIQDWPGVRITNIGSQLWWNWQLGRDLLSRVGPARCRPCRARRAHNDLREPVPQHRGRPRLAVP